MVIEGNTFTQENPKHSLFHRDQEKKPSSFGEMKELGGDAEEGEEDEPLRALNRKMFEKDAEPKTKKMVRDRTKTMMKEQRDVEKKSRKQNESSQGLLKRASQTKKAEEHKNGKEKKGGTDWEYI